MPGKFLKKAARACTGKARFESAESAVRHSQGRLRSYRCAICGAWHLTSQSGPAPVEKGEPKPLGPLAKLADLTWPEVPPVEPPRDEEMPTYATCRGRYDREGRVLLEIGERRLRSLTVPASERPDYGDGVSVRIAWRKGRPFIVARAVD
ncbi:hypothetical protein EON81_03105 [bacterium]|nr:MAG: hypothetical protein EON81_03105 [bacterium]